jgi:cytochrome c2
MNHRLIFIGIFVISLAMILTTSVDAGGWAVITLDDLVEQAVAGEDLEIGFMVRQHGVNPMMDLTPSIIATHTEKFESFRVQAQSQGSAGHYVARLNFPQPGTWNWSIRAFTMEQPMPPLMVLSAPNDQWNTGIISSFPIWAAGLGIAATAVVCLWLVRRKSRWIILLLLVALIFTLAGFALGAGQTPSSEKNNSSSLSLRERGEALFLAKGCIICHNHSDVSSKHDVVSDTSGPAGSAPNLSSYSSSSEFLRRWLAEPTKVRPNTTMPDLDLTSGEIEALIAFLNRSPESAPTHAQVQKNNPPESCPVTQPPDPPFTPPPPYPSETPSTNEFWYGSPDLWTMLRVDGTWWGLPYHEEGGGHYINKVVWWNQDYDWRAEPQPAFKVKARRLDSPAPIYETSEATNLYHETYGSAILTGVEIPTLGCWEFTGKYQGAELSFVVWVSP